MERIQAVIEIHPKSSALALALDWDVELAGRSLLCRTVEAVLACDGVAGLMVVTPAEEGEDFAHRVESALAAAFRSGKKLSVRAFTGRDPQERERIGRARRLAPAAWRAGWVIPHAVAERGDPVRLLAAARALGVDEIILFPAHAPFVDDRRVTELVRARAESRDAMLRLATTPPGVSGDVVASAYLDGIVGKGVELDDLIRFLPDHPERDLDTKGAFHWYGQEVNRLRHRFSAESRRGLAVLESIESWRRERSVVTHFGGRWMDELAASGESLSVLRGPVPAELRLRVTTACRGLDRALESAGAARHMDPGLVAKLASELASWQEPRVVLGGGEPLLHPDIDAVLEAVASAGVGAVVLETDGIGLDAVTSRLLDSVDVVVARLDAATPAVYEALHGGDLSRVESDLEALIEAADAHPRQPRVAVELREVRENQHQIETFLDRWFSRTPWVVVSRFRDHAGQLERAPLQRHGLSERIPCAQIEESLTVHPDGRAAICDNDLRLADPSGDLTSSTLESVWDGEPLETRRAVHAAGDWASVPICAGCEDWCRR